MTENRLERRRVGEQCVQTNKQHTQRAGGELEIRKL